MQKIAIIPAYEPPREFVGYVKDLLSEVDALVVVDDGSGSGYADIFSQAEALGASVISYPENRGKGYALRKAFEYCSENFSPSDIVITADCDGQHLIGDVMRVAEASEQYPEALVLGSRDFSGDNVPQRSRAGNNSMRRLFRWLYGIDVYDSQTGLRACSVETATKFLSVSGDRFEYETSVLIFAKRNQIPIYEERITTVYPEPGEEHISHFKPLNDSARVVWVLVKNLWSYVGASTFAMLIDVCIFITLSTFVFTSENPFNTMIATVSARAVSSIVNFTINCRHIFHGKAKHSIARYYTLVFLQLCCSYSIVYIFSHKLSLPLIPVKLCGDLVLALISYQIQCRWVFRKKKVARDFYGPVIQIGRWFARMFSRKFFCAIEAQDEPAIYVCRHLDMHGPYVTIKWLPFQVHPMTLSVFLDRKESIKQYTEYTFSERVHKKKKKFNLKAWFVGNVTYFAMRSLRAVPVYRKNSGAIVTFRKGMEYLLANESLIVWPDIEYTADKEKKSEIYEGFLYFGQLYRKKTGKSLRFVPLIIDDNNHQIIAGNPVIVDDFKKEAHEAAEKLREEINR